jgi:hypothetical protein
MSDWQALGKRDPLALENARLQIHWAAQTIAAAGMTFVEHAADDSHTNMEWLGSRRLLAGQVVVAGEPSFRVAINPSDLTLVLLELDDDEIGQLSLNGHTLEQCYDWLSSTILPLIEKDDAELDRPTFELPQHPVATGERFSIDDSESFVEVGRWFANADLVLRAAQEETPAASPVRCWPHHFDIATLIEVDPDAKKTIGVGMTPGDGNYAEPYWYVTPWPYPTADNLPSLETGTWHTEGWIGAVLTGSAVVAAGDARAQHDLSTSFVNSAIQLCKDLL